MAQQSRLKWLTLVAVVVGLSGCATTGNLLSAFGSGEPVELREVRRALACGSTTNDVLLSLMDGPASYAQWETQRGAQLYGDAVLSGGQYLLIEMGRRGSEGYGMAVSSAAALKGNKLILRATFIEPPLGSEPTGEAVSPCSLVKLPDLPIKTIELMDQTGKRRATLQWEGNA